jgi:dihydroxy-acid dehydratase
MARTPRTTRPGPARGFGRLHADHVLQADQGCDFDFLQDPQAAQPTTAAS